jgi:Spy/CpxP family protein refolding chaperone
MNFFNRTKITFWVMIVLIVINIAALISYFYFSRPACETPGCENRNGSENALQTALGLTAEQSAKVATINETYQQTAGPVSAAIKENRGAILTEMEKENPDSAAINTLIRNLSELQIKLQQENIRQYMELKKVCNSEQAQKLSAFYRELYGCPMKGKQMQQRHRHGQERRQ